ncbi:unnamed protein product [Alopecurus aequalis]
MERSRRRDRDDLPDDVLADVLRRLPPRWVAVSRCVSKAWRRAIDECYLLRVDLLPFSLAGIFMHFEEHKFPEFFARPSSRKVNASLEFVPPTIYPADEIYDELEVDHHVFDHCNGLLLVNDYVVNPATRCWDPLPTSWCLADPMGITRIFDRYLAFDPTVSPHYQVFKIPYLLPIPYKPGDPRYRSPRDDVNPLVEKSEWPPSAFIMNVFSSRSGRWEERSFAREGDAAGVVAELRRRKHRGSAYWRQALYVHCQANFVMRISLSDDKYRVIKPPPMEDMDKKAHPYLGRSENGVYFASFMEDVFRVWILNESQGHAKWMLKGKYDLKRVGAFDQRVHGPWVLEDINYQLVRSQLSEVNKKAIVEEKYEWNSDDDDGADDNRSQLPEVNGKAIFKDRREWDFHVYNGDLAEGRIHGCSVLRFHPFKEILFFSSFGEKEWMATVHAYHLNSLRVECLGNMCPTRFDHFAARLPELGVYAYFPYTPCWTGKFPRNK